MKLAAVSDLHGHLPDIPECDLLLIVGDICPVDNHERKYQADWLRSTFTDWMRMQPAKMTVWCGGNHDFILEDWAGQQNKIAQVSGLYLNNNWLELYPGMLPEIEWPEEKPLKIWGSPYSNRFGDWAFMKDEDELRELYRTIPRDVDIIITHGPPHGYGDLVPVYSFSAIKRGWESHSGTHVGSTSLYNQLTYDEWPNLKLILTGHIHESFGKYELNGVPLYNVSHMDGRYEPNNPVTEIELNG